MKFPLLNGLTRRRSQRSKDSANNLRNSISQDDIPATITAPIPPAQKPNIDNASFTSRPPIASAHYVRAEPSDPPLPQPASPQPETDNRVLHTNFSTHTATSGTTSSSATTTGAVTSEYPPDIHHSTSQTATSLQKPFQDNGKETNAVPTITFAIPGDHSPLPANNLVIDKFYSKEQQEQPLHLKKNIEPTDSLKTRESEKENPLSKHPPPSPLSVSNPTEQAKPIKEISKHPPPSPPSPPPSVSKLKEVPIPIVPISKHRPPPSPPLTEAKFEPLVPERRLGAAMSPFRKKLQADNSSDISSTKSRFSRQKFVDNASRFRRFFRERVSYTRTSGDNSSSVLGDIPESLEDEELKTFSREISTDHANAVIAEFAASQRGTPSTPKERPWNRKRRSSVDYDDRPEKDEDEEEEEVVPRMPSEIPELQPCNDGTVEFTVPKGWVATRSTDSFCLWNGRSVGFVRTVPARCAADALLDTDRLQVMSHVHARSSPTLENGYAVVYYSSHLGAGKGYVLGLLVCIVKPSILKHIYTSFLFTSWLT